MSVWKRDTFLAIASIGSRKKIDLLTVEAQLAHSADTHAVCILETAFDIRAWHLRHRASLQRGERARRRGPGAEPSEPFRFTSLPFAMSPRLVPGRPHILP